MIPKCLPMVGITTLAMLFAAGCGAEPEVPADDPHGFVEDAQEMAEAQPRLVLTDPDSGSVAVLDAVSEDVTTVDDVDGSRGLLGDGRFAFAVGRDDSTTVIDTGAWKVDHGDHVHYYTAQSRRIGTLTDGRPVSVHADSSVTAITFADGEATVLDREALAAGALESSAQLSNTGTVVPWHERLLVASRSSDRVEVRNRSGEALTTIDEPCADPQGSAVTRRGVVFECTDGALLVTGEGDSMQGTKIGYPEPVSNTERANDFRHRPGATTLAAQFGERGVWTLDVSAQRWNRMDVGPVTAVDSVGEGGPVLALTAEGVLHSFDPSSGAELDRTAPIAPARGSVLPSITVDNSRAYVNDVTTGTVHEIDYNDRLRIARSFDLDGASSHMIETGR